MPRVLVIDHYDSYTYNLVHLIASVSGVLPEVVQHDDPEAIPAWQRGYSHLVLSPGPGTVNDPRDFALGRQVIAESAVPVLGVCLGMQGIVSVLGGSVDIVEPAHGDLAAVEHTGRGLFAGVPQGVQVVRYHSQAVIEAPDCVEVTAWCDGPDGRVVMGVQHSRRPLHGVQFHPESVLTEHGATMVGNFLALS
ncbi:MAG: aminodeoxychorismate/anthranilate synthase component II [Nocardioidaceae bacterium]|nr:aminodeoxychorismate/anthranilate synthase component II [Nocardioidaceae bacterium]